jgi:hypothetical protein
MRSCGSRSTSAEQSRALSRKRSNRSGYGRECPSPAVGITPAGAFYCTVSAGARGVPAGLLTPVF